MRRLPASNVRADCQRQLLANCPPISWPHGPSLLGAACVVCGAHGANTTLRRCSRCRTSYYCSTECQQQDWPTHKLECVKVKDKAEKK